MVGFKVEIIEQEKELKSQMLLNVTDQKTSRPAFPAEGQHVCVLDKLSVFIKAVLCLCPV